MARDFNGTTDRLDYRSAFNTTGQAFTLSLWVYCDDVAAAANQYFFNSAVSGGGPGTLFQILTGGTGLLSFLRVGSAIMVRTSNTFSLPASQWVHVLVTTDGTLTAAGTHIYVNGVEVGYAESTDGATETTANSGFSLGGRSSDDARNFNGREAEVGMWDYIVPYATILDLSKGKAPSFFPHRLRFYPDLRHDYLDRITNTGTADGTVEVFHPRIIYPVRERIIFPPPPGAPDEDISATGSIVFTGAGDLDATGTLAAVGAIAWTGVADLDAAADLVAVGAIAFTSAADLDALGQLAAAGAIAFTTSADLRSIDLVAVGAIAFTSSADLDALGNLEAVGAITWTTSADLAGDPNAMLAVGAIAFTSSADLDALANILAVGAITFASSADLDATGKLEAVGALVFGSSADADTIADLLATGAITITGSVDLDATGNILAVGALQFTSSAGLVNGSAGAQPTIDNPGVVSGSPRRGLVSRSPVRKTIVTH